MTSETSDVLKIVNQEYNYIDGVQKGF